MANKKISELPYINGGEISGNTLVPLVTYFSATTGDTVHTYITDLQNYLTSGITASGNYLPLSGGTVSGGTQFTAGITANTISATTYQNLPSSTFSGGTVTGPTIFTNGLTANTISATTYQNLPTDVRVTGGTYSAGTVTFTNNTGGTFNVTGLTTGSTSTVSGDFLPLSGGTVSGATRFLSGLTANTISADTLTVTDNISSTNRTLYRAPSGGFLESVDYGNSKLWGVYAPSIDWELRQIYDEQATMAINYSGVTRYLIDDIGQTSVDWQARKLYTSIGEEVFDWENGILTGQTNIESSTISATTYLNLPGGLSGAYLPLSGGTVTGSSTFTSGLTINYIDFDTTPTVPSPTGGTLYYDSTENALSYKPITPSNDVTVNLGQESVIRFYNNLGVQINNGQALHITGATSGSPTVSLAIGTGGDAVQFQISGIATHDVPNSSYGFMTVFGVVRDINLTGFTVGEQVYLSQTTPGGFAPYSGLSFTGRTCEVGHVLDNSASGKLQVTILNEIEGTIITTQENNILAANNSSTGVFEFSGLTIDTPSGTTFSVGKVEGWIIDNVTAPANPSIKLIIYPGSSGNTSLYYSSATETYVLLTSGLTLTQQTTFPTPQQRRQNLYLGKFGHGNKQFLINAFNEPDSALSPVSQLRDMFTAIKLVNDGVIASANGVNLSFNTSAGILYGLGIGYVTNKLNPNSLTINSQSPATFQYRTQTGGTAANTTLIDPLSYDVGGVKTLLTGTKATNQRIYLLQNGQIRVQYGQTDYNQLAAAVAALQNETFVTFPNFRDNGVLIGILSVLSTCTNLSDTSKAQFFSVSKFGELIGAAGGTSTTTLQQAYNNSATPEITTNSTLGPLSVKNGAGTADNITNVFEGVNSGGTTTSYVRADGFISGNSLNAPNLIISGGTQSIFSGDSSSDLVRITQTGVGNAFVVDDSTNPDTTPFVINSGGSVSIGTTSVFSVGAGAETKLNVSTGSSGVATTGLSVSTPIIIESTVGTSIGLLNPDVANSQLYFGTPSDAFGAFLRWDYTNRNLILSTANGTGKLIFQTANSVESARIDQSGNMGIGLTGATQKLEVSGNTRIYGGISAQTATISGSGQSILTVIGSGNSTTSPLFSVQGSSGELFSVTDSLVGSLFSVNDISGLPIMEVFSDNTTLWGSYQAPSLNTTTRTSLTAGTNTIYSIPTSAYTGAFYEYTLISTGTTGARAGQIMSIWSGTSANFTETSTLDIGTTTGVTFTVAVSGSNAVLSSSATTAGWTVKTIIRSI
jgi:hypothetical protein